MSEKIPDSAGKARDEAVEWCVRLESCEADETLRRAHREWLAESGANRHAWECLQAVDQQFASLSGGNSTRRVLQQRLSHRLHRWRTVTLSLLLTGLCVQLADPMVVERLKHDYVTNVGERRTIGLDGGVRIQMNAASAIDVNGNADAGYRINLRTGAINLETGQASPVVTHGALRITPVGTRFGITTDPYGSTLYVTRGSVRVEAPDTTRAVKAGAGLRYSSTDARFNSLRNPEQHPTWTNGIVNARALSIREFVRNLRPYTRAYIHLDEAIANETVSGLFPLDSPITSLRAIEDTAPVSVDTSLPMVVRITARPTDDSGG